MSSVPMPVTVSDSDILRAHCLQTQTFWICRKKSHHLDLNKQVLKSLELDDYCSDLCFWLVACSAIIILSQTDVVCSFSFLKQPCRRT